MAGKLDISKATAKRLFSGFSAEGKSKRVYLRNELVRLIRSKRGDWKLPEALSASDSISALMKAGLLSKVRLISESEGAPLVRFVAPGATEFEIGLSLRPGACLSHGSAVSIHGFTDQVLTTIYVNKEQSRRPEPPGQVTQEEIDRAFQRPPRSTKLAYALGGARFVVLNGQHTGGCGVVGYPVTTGIGVRVTGPERTLIDIAMRPQYAGGIHAVLSAYRAALPTVSVPAIARMIGDLGFAYPWHQSVGFLLAKAGASAAILGPLADLGIERDFYMVHGMVRPKFDSTWRIHFPQSL